MVCLVVGWDGVGHLYGLYGSVRALETGIGSDPSQ